MADHAKGLPVTMPASETNCAARRHRRPAPPLRGRADPPRPALRSVSRCRKTACLGNTNTAT